MSLIALGVALWSAVHFFPALAPRARGKLIDRLGQWTYQGLFSAGVIAALLCMVLGWRSAEVVTVYQPAAGMATLTSALMALAAVLFISARAPTDIRRALRHPQLGSIVLWALAHLLSNGDSRSLLLFGGLGLWALLEMGLISRREGAWQKPAPAGVVRTVISMCIGLALWLVLAFAHPWLAGVPVLRG